MHCLIGFVCRFLSEGEEAERGGEGGTKTHVGKFSKAPLAHTPGMSRTLGVVLMRLLALLARSQVDSCPSSIQ